MQIGGVNLIGQADSFVRMLKWLQRYAKCEACVLIQGETGTGKELAARAIHYLSQRQSHPFIPVNCGAIPDTLVQSELFGHVRGAFTDAREAREGLIAQSQGGTLFLDEVDALSVRSQVALLRFLQDHQYRRVGGGGVRNADVRVVACTNADLSELVEQGMFRRDLLYRFSVLTLVLPPLRERPGDALLLAEAFLRRLNHQYGTSNVLHPELISFIESHAWLGNVRELENFIHREFLLADGATLRRHDAAIGAPQEREIARERSLTQRGFKQAKAQAVAEFERAYITELLERTAGNISHAARLAGKERSLLGKLARKYGLAREDFRAL